MTAILLVHSPLVGPATLRPLAEALEEHGFSTLLPDVRGASSWRAFGELAVSSAQAGGFAPAVVLGHSGAGAMVPAIACALGAGRSVFVDAVLPPESGNWAPTGLIRTRLDTMAGPNRVLPPWHEWWNPNMMRRLVPDAPLRTLIESECRPVSLDLYDSPAPQPDDWSSPESCVYIQLSTAYTDDAADAGGRAWPVLVRDGHHLDSATCPSPVAELIVRALAVRRVRVGEIGALRRRGGVTVPRNAPGLLVVAPAESAPYAVINECAHQGAELLAGYVSATGGVPWIECPLHMWRYDLATGRRLIRDEFSTDPRDCLRTFPCEVDRSGMIWVEPRP